MDQLDKYRNEIDSLDEELIKLLDKRFQISMHIKEYKDDNNMAIKDEKRETYIKEKILSYRGSQQVIEQILEVYNTILKASKLLQK
ncbi:MAG: chorismate mutase [Erysipelotrichales bacterium]